MRFTIFLLTTFYSKNLVAAEAGMPQLDPTFWASQGFWLVITFLILYFSISKIFLPKIKNNLDNREKKIKNDLEEAKKLKDLADKKKSEYNRVIEDTKKEVAKILLENNNKLKKDIQNKKEGFEKEINLELDKAQKNIENLKSNSMEKIQIISENIATQLVEKISGDKLNNSSIKAVVKEITKKNLNNYL